MGNVWGSKAASNGRNHGGEKAGAARVYAGAPGGGKAGAGAAKGMNKDNGVRAGAGNSTPRGMKVYKEGKGVKV